MPLVVRAEPNQLFPYRVLFREHPSLSVDQWNRPSWRAKMNAQPASGKRAARRAHNVQPPHAELSVKTRAQFLTFLACCLTSSLAQGDSIHQRSRRDCNGGTDNCRKAVFAVGEGHRDHTY